MCCSACTFLGCSTKGGVLFPKVSSGTFPEAISLLPCKREFIKARFYFYGVVLRLVAYSGDCSKGACLPLDIPVQPSFPYTNLHCYFFALTIVDVFSNASKANRRWTGSVFDDCTRHLIESTDRPANEAFILFGQTIRMRTYNLALMTTCLFLVHYESLKIPISLSI